MIDRVPRHSAQKYGYTNICKLDKGIIREDLCFCQYLLIKLGCFERK